MLKTCSICENRLYLTLYKKGASAACRSFIIYCRKNNLSAKGTPYTNRLGLTVSTKVGCAVKRNRCKRVFREAYRQMEPMIPDGWDIVLVARSVTPELPFQTVKKDLEYALKKLRVIKSEAPGKSRKPSDVKSENTPSEDHTDPSLTDAQETGNNE